MTIGTVFLTQRELEARWKLSGRTLERWRAEDHGPPWVIIGGSIRYLFSEIEEFEARNSQPKHLSGDGQDGGTI